MGTDPLDWGELIMEQNRQLLEAGVLKAGTVAESWIQEHALMDDICFAIKDENGYYYCGLKKWDKQLRKAQLFHSIKHAAAVRDNPEFAALGVKTVRVHIYEIGEYNPDWEV